MRQKVIIYSCSETYRLTICGTLHWVWNNSGSLISHHLKGDISLCYPVAPSHLDPSSVAIMCCFWSNTRITASLWDWAWIFHVCLTASTVFNLYMKTEVEIQCSPKWQMALKIYPVFLDSQRHCLGQRANVAFLQVKFCFSCSWMKDWPVCCLSECCVSS